MTVFEELNRGVMLKSIEASRKLLVDTDKLLQHADKLLAKSHKTLKITNSLASESLKNLIESKNLLQKYDSFSKANEEV